MFAWCVYECLRVCTHVCLCDACECMYVHAVLSVTHVRVDMPAWVYLGKGGVRVRMFVCAHIRVPT